MPSDSLHDLAAYAELTVRVGLDLQPGQRLTILAPIEAAPLAREIARRAYQLGSPLVNALWTDEQLRLIRFQNAPRDSFQEFPAGLAEALIETVRQGGAYCKILSEDPDLLAGQDPALISVAEKSASRHQLPFMTEVSRNGINWCVIGYPIPSWANRVFPNAPQSERLELLWDAILQTSRLDPRDPVGAWKQHLAELARRRDYLSEKQYTALHLTAPGTDLTIGMPERYIWMGGAARTVSGIEFVPNVPTEEVFSLPHKDRTEGVVRATKPLSYAGSLIENFSLTFEQGHVVKVQAEKGEAVLRGIIETDEGAGRLGEIALVPNSSPISRMGIMFYNTLYDENAATHIALGRGYAFALQGGQTMSPEELSAAGRNDSLMHVDFMIGSAEMNIDGLTAAGAREPVMRAGEWAS